MADDTPALKRPKLDHTEQPTDNLTPPGPDSAAVPTSSEQAPTTRKQPFLEKPVTESAVGITEYISDHKGFQGIIKQRFSDFLVNEVDLSGQTVHLTDTSRPEREHTKVDKVESSTEDVLSTSQVEDLARLAHNSLEEDEVVIQAGGDKQQRTLIHEAVRRRYPQLESSTADRDGAKVIVVTTSVKSAGQDRRRGKSQPVKRNEPWPHPGADYCQFCLYKENMDTMEAVNILSKYLFIKPSMVTYAGTKDKRAKTCQKMTVYRIPSSRLYSLNHKLRCMALGNFSYVKNSLKLGDLKGNHFVIILRSVTGSPDQINQALTSLKEVGFINYFGMQRFGTSSVPTHLVGRELLKSNWQEAIELIMKPRQGAKENISKARVSWWTERDAGKALDILGNQHCPERHLLHGLKQRNSKDLVGALGCIPRNQRTMYIHAYQSYLWNKMLSRRVRDFGLQPIIGDLVFDSQTQTQTENDTDGEVEKKEFTHPKLVTEENISTYTIYDVVLPLPGYDVMFPQNTVGQGCRDLLEQDGLSVDALRHRVKDYSLRGQYRHILIKPEDLSWETLRYNNGNDSLVLSDLEKLNGVELPEYNPEGQHLALKVEFTLPSSTYATMAIREVLKQDTSSASQAQLTMATRATTGDSEGGKQHVELAGAVSSSTSLQNDNVSS